MRRGVESVKFFTDEELLAAGESPENLRDAAYVRAWPVLEGIELFDSGFFGMSPRDAAVMDPQHRIFLEVAWEALEDAGYDVETLTGQVGVFASNGMNTYMMHHLVTNREVMETVGEWLVRHTGNDMNFLATRVSYQMNLTGPSLNVQTACSSSLVAIHLACQSLLSGECDLALAGASALSLPQDRGYLFRQGEILSPNGHCRPFDAGSRGTLFGSGAGCIVLKRLGDARAANDPIVAVIRGTAINNDGSMKIGYLAPSVDGQARAIAEAIAISGVDAESISYIEAHGTGTAVGDPIEIAALTQAFRGHTEKRGFCAIGSVKANIGHLGEAAGMAGIIKTALALRHRELPPSINYEKPNPEIDFENSPVFVNTKLRPWIASEPRHAGVTSLGAGGTNAHIILEEAPPRAASGPARPLELILLSARTEAALERATDRLAAHLQDHRNLSLSDVAYTLQVGRKQFGHRRALVASSIDDTIQALKARDAKRLHTFASDKAAPSVVFMFPGGGAQYAGMGRELYTTQAAYRAGLDEALSVLETELATSLRGLLLDPRDPARDGSELARPSLSLTALFATEYAMARQLMAWGLEPAAMIGHSMGEYVAAVLSGVMSVRDAQAMLLLRGRLLETLHAGAMLSVSLPERELLPYLNSELCLAGVNAESLCVVSGPVSAIAALEATLTAKDLDCTRLHISVAGHSSMLDPILGEFERFCRSVHFQAPQLPFMSNLTGSWITEKDATDPLYWVRHLRQTVRFADGLAEVLRGASRVLVEVGPGRTLSSLARSQQPGPIFAFSTLRHPQENVSDVGFLLQTLGRLWTHGVKPDWQRFRADESRNRVPLPTYSFEPQRYWIERGDALEQSGTSRQRDLKKKPDVADWFYLPSFRRSVPGKRSAEPGGWLVFCDGSALSERLLAKLPGAIVRVTPGHQFSKRSEGHYTVEPSRRGDYEQLFEELARDGFSASRIVHLWAVTKRSLLGDRWAEPKSFDELRARYFDSLFCLAQALSTHEERIDLSVISNDLHVLTDELVPDPTKALLLGPVRVIPREMPHVHTRNIDFHVADRGHDAAALDGVVSELLCDVTDPVVTYRGRDRWTASFDRARLPPAAGTPACLRPRGVYVITGGLGGIGLEVAEHLARIAKARLVLVGRSPVPPREDWDAWLARHGTHDPTSTRIQKLRAIEAQGGEVLTLSADVTDRDQMGGALSTARERFGAIHGIVHSAGVIDDQIIALKTLESAHAVLATKVQGALVLDSLLVRDRLDFFVVFSSVSSILGLEGQIDYTSANAFLDVFAQKKAASGTRTLSINWNAWQSVGMAVVLADKGRPPTTSAGNTGPHPMLGRVIEDEAAESLYATNFSRAEHWLLAEHVVHGGDALIPGTGYLELARAALEHHAETRPIELSNVFFLAPFSVRVGETRELRLRLKRSGPAAGEFSFVSHSEDAPHVTGRVSYVDAAEPRPANLDELFARCCVQVKDVEGFIDQPFADFGPRWGNVRQIAYGRGEAALRLELPAGYQSDLEHIRLHPALLDMATGGAQALIPGFDQGRDFYVPFSYGKLRLYRSLPAQCVSHVRYKNAAEGLASFDVTLYETDGSVVATITDFVMKRVDHASVLSADSTSSEASRGAMTRLGTVVKQGILPAEGMDALDRILASSVNRQVVACSVDLHEWQARVDAEALDRAATDKDSGAEQSSFARPELSTKFIAPRDEVERDLSGMWRELLGLREVGIHDDFFEVGGQSLIAVRLFNKIRKRWSVDLPLSTLFEAPTIERCAEIIREEAGLGPFKATNGHDSEAPLPASVRPAAAKKSRWSSLVAIQPTGTLPPFFCIAGMGGTLGNLRTLALLLGTDRPFYGLQPPGADDPKQRLYRVEDLARHYIREIRSVQPQGPYFLGGYSGGGIAAFEMTRQLEAENESVAFLGFLDSFSPSLPMRPLPDRARLHLRRMQSEGPTYVTAALARRFGYEKTMFTRRVQRELGKIFPERYRYENLSDSWVVAESHYDAKPWSGTATLFRAREESALSLWTAYVVDEEHGWGRFVKGGVTVVMCDGNHTTMCEEPYARDLAQKLRFALDARTPQQRARGSSPPPSKSPSAPPVSAHTE